MRDSSPAGVDVSDALWGMLRDDERLLWHYRPARGLYFRQSIAGVVIGGLLIWTIFYGMFVVVPVLLEFADSVESTLGTSAPVALGLGWVVVQIGWFVLATLASYRAYGRLEFAATDRRAIRLGGLIGLDTSAVDWETVQEIELDRSGFTALFGTGSIVVRTAGGGRTYDGGGVTFHVVEDPERVVGRLEAIRRGTDDGAPIPAPRGKTRDAPGVDAPRPALTTGDLPAYVRQLLHESEDVVWHGRPAFGPFTAAHLAFGVVTVAVGAVIVTSFPEWSFFALVALGGVERAGRRLLRYRNAEYVATTERVVGFDGVIGRDYSSVAWDDVQDVEVETGALDGVFGTGTLRFSRAGRASPQERRMEGDSDGPAFAGVQFRSVPNPRTVIDRLEEARHGTSSEGET